MNTIFRDEWTPISGAGGFEEIPVTSLGAVGLTRPARASGAWIFIESDSASTEDQKEKSVRMKLNGIDPTTALGAPLGNRDVLEITNKGQIDNFLVIAIDAGLTHKVHVQYFIK